MCAWHPIYECIYAFTTAEAAETRAAVRGIDRGPLEGYRFIGVVDQSCGQIPHWINHVGRSCRSRTLIETFGHILLNRPWVYVLIVVRYRVPGIYRIPHMFRIVQCSLVGFYVFPRLFSFFQSFSPFCSWKSKMSRRQHFCEYGRRLLRTYQVANTT